MMSSLINLKICHIHEKAYHFTKTQFIQFSFFDFPDPKLDLPRNWTDMSGSDVYKLEPLVPSSAEYMEVSKAFVNTCNRQIVKVGASYPSNSKSFQAVSSMQLLKR